MADPKDTPKAETLDDADVDAVAGGATKGLMTGDTETKAGGNDVLQQEWSIVYETIQR